MQLTFWDLGHPAVTDRERALLPGGVPRWLRLYDNGGESGDRYTIVFTGRYQHKTMNCQWYVGSSADPYWPQGIYIHCEFSRGYWIDKEKKRWQYAVDRPRSSHLGKRIKWEQLPDAVQDAVLTDYLYLWDLGPGKDLEYPPPGRKESREFAQRVKEAA
jgi:hypothetical protein